MKKFILLAVFAIVGLTVQAKADSIGYYTATSTGISVSTTNRINLVGYTVSTGSGSQYFVLIDTVAFGVTMGEDGPVAGFKGLGSYPATSHLAPQLALVSTGTANTAYQNTVWLPGDGIPVKYGLFIYGSATGGQITVYTKPTPASDR